MYRSAKAEIRKKSLTKPSFSVSEDISRMFSAKVSTYCPGLDAFSSESTSTPIKSDRHDIKIKDETDAGRLIKQHMSVITAEQKGIIRTTFAPAKGDLAGIGLKVLILVFQEHPQYKNIWPKLRAIDASALMHSGELRMTASLFMNSLNKMIDSFENEPVLLQEIERIAKVHTAWRISRSHVLTLTDPLFAVMKHVHGDLPTAVTDAWLALFTAFADLFEIFGKQARAQKKTEIFYVLLEK